jgi:hypothetical protein
MAARMVIPADGTTLTLVFDPIEMQARGDTMTGRFSMTTTATGIGGQLVVDFDVPGLTRSFGLSSAGGETGALGDRIARRLLRRR